MWIVKTAKVLSMGIIYKVKIRKVACSKTCALRIHASLRANIYSTYYGMIQLLRNVWVIANWCDKKVIVLHAVRKYGLHVYVYMCGHLICMCGVCVLCIHSYMHFIWFNVMLKYLFAALYTALITWDTGLHLGILECSREMQRWFWRTPKSKAAWHPNLTCVLILKDWFIAILHRNLANHAADDNSWLARSVKEKAPRGRKMQKKIQKM